ncbi:ATP-binding protein [Longimycelium tulufanense]|uniref:ATP-binding protein n=1 Tax=Longimycelium tulufanense TaxID=907463 RepID=A0A8J3CAV5_9PSEU|nr:ATP-binding protein [Longimycelium tulufanense]GGM67109.1 ATP-binding protein [Longimycelium tulufanense]
MIDYGRDYPDPFAAELATIDPYADVPPPDEPMDGREVGADGGGADRDGKPSMATRLVELAQARYDVFLGQDGEPYAVDRAGVSLALPLRGRTGLRQRLARAMFATIGRVPPAAALTDCVNVLEGTALERDRVPVALRVARRADRLVIDMGTADGRVIECGPHGWRVVRGSDVLFRRTALTGAMPDPDPAGTLDAFRSGLNVSEENFRLIVGWMLHAFMPDEPHPVLGLVGEQGTAKTTAAKQVACLVDPSPAPTRTAPKDLSDWAVTAAGSWVVTLDNISTIPPWFSDALCKAVTGDAMTKRALYTDGDLSVLAFLRPVIMTTIEAGALRGDLAERMLPIELERIPPDQRRTEKSVRLAYEDAMPQTLGALLNLLCDVLAVLPGVHLSRLPRMADFARFLAALDQVTGWTTHQDYEDTFEDLADTVIDGDPFAAQIRANIERGLTFDGTAAALLGWLHPNPEGTPSRGWPKTPRGATGALKRSTPALLKVGIHVEHYRTSDHKRERRVRIRRADGPDGVDGSPRRPSVHTQSPGWGHPG